MCMNAFEGIPREMFWGITTEIILKNPAIKIIFFWKFRRNFDSILKNPWKKIKVIKKEKERKEKEGKKNILK